jgi:hypothetical protein
MSTPATSSEAVHMDSPSTDFANEPANDILPIISPQVSAGSSSASLHDGNAPPLESADLDASLSTESNCGWQ